MVMLIRALLVFTDTSGCIEASRKQEAGSGKRKAGKQEAVLDWTGLPRK